MVAETFIDRVAKAFINRVAEAEDEFDCMSAWLNVQDAKHQVKGRQGWPVMCKQLMQDSCKLDLRSPVSH